MNEIQIANRFLEYSERFSSELHLIMLSISESIRLCHSFCLVASETILSPETTRELVKFGIYHTLTDSNVVGKLYTFQWHKLIVPEIENAEPKELEQSFDNFEIAE